MLVSIEYLSNSVDIRHESNHSINQQEGNRPMKRLIASIAILLVSSLSWAGTGFLKGEQTSGLNKICYYEGASGSFTKTIGAVGICPLSADDGRGPAISSPGLGGGSIQYNQPRGNTGFLSGEQTSGLNKICYYDSARGTFTKVVGAAQLCPLNAQQ